jgi:hypothetical protein
MRKKYLRKKQMRTSDENSIPEEIRSNVNNSIFLKKDKSEGKESKNKSEQSSSTLSNRAKDEKQNTFSYRGKKDKREDKESTPSKKNSEQSSSTLSNRAQDEKQNTFSYRGKKDKSLSVKQNKEETQNMQNMDYFNQQFQFLQKQLDELKEQKKAHEVKINSLIEEKLAQELKINSLIEENLDQEVKFNNFKKTNELKIHAQEVRINNLQEDITALNVQVKELDKYFFAGKLRKLSKKLIEYIINNFYNSYMKSFKFSSSKRIYFVKAPRFSKLNWAKDNDIVNALNRLLEQLFSKAKSNDLVIHFFDIKANKNDSLKKTYSVFKNKDEFFRYFNIIGNDKIILDTIFPKDNLTIIDNTSEDISIKNLLSEI